MAQELDLELEMPKHPSGEDRKTFKQATDMLREHLTSAGASGHWIAKSETKTRMRGGRLRVGTYDPIHRYIKFTVKSGGNDTAWVYNLQPPPEEDVAAWHRTLSDHTVAKGGLVTEEGAPVTPAASPPTPEPPAAPESPDPAKLSPLEMMQQLQQKMERLRVAAEAYEDRAARIRKLSSDIEQAMRTMEALEAEQAADQAGATAVATLRDMLSI